MNGPGDRFAGWCAVLVSLFGVWLTQIRAFGRVCVFLGGFFIISAAQVGVGMLLAALLRAHFFPVPQGLVAEIDFAHWILRHTLGCLLVYYSLGFTATILLFIGVLLILLRTGKRVKYG